jgi:Flp pilus assembly protein TadB
MSFIFALVFGLGIYMLVFGPIMARRQARRTGIERLSKMTDKPVEEDLSKLGFWQVTRKKGLKSALEQAELDVSVAGFLRTGAIVVVVVAALVYLSTSNLFVGLVMGLLGIFVYVNWLQWRRDKKRLEYDSALADMCDRLASGAQLNNTLLGTISHANLSAPPAVAGDFQAAERILTQGGTIQDAFGPIIARRKSYSLEMLTDALYTWSSRGTSISLSEVLRPLADTIREIAKERETVEADLSGVRYRLIFVALSPIAYVGLVRAMMPAINQVYNTFIGGVLLIIGFTISLSTYYLGERQMAKPRKTLDI